MKNLPMLKIEKIKKIIWSKKINMKIMNKLLLIQSRKWNIILIAKMMLLIKPIHTNRFKKIWSQEQNL
jgi:hypothetical protein